MIRITLLITIFLTHCSFDNKSGIWQNNSETISKSKERFEDFKTLYSKEATFNSKIAAPLNFKISVDKSKNILKWTDEFYNKSNNLENYNYKNLNKIIFKSKKLSRNKLNKHILYNRNLLILSDSKGNIILYSMKTKKF